MTQTNDAPTPVLDNAAQKIQDSATHDVQSDTTAIAPSELVQSLLTSQQYNVLKWVTIIVLPAITTAYGTLSSIWGWPYGDQIVASLAAITLLLGVIIGVSTSSYNKSSAGPAGTLVVDNSGTGQQTYLAFDQDPKTLAEGSQITLNVTHAN